MASVPSRIRYEHTSRSAEALIDQLTTGALNVAAHQRAFVWSLDNQKRMVETVQRGMPTASITIRAERSEAPTLEDGQQRLTTLRRYFNDEFVDKQGRLFSALGAREQMEMKMYMFGITQYWNATNSDAIKIFDYFQNGVALSVGDRLHALTTISPIIRFTNELILDPAGEYHERSVAVWGRHDGTAKKRIDLVMAFAITCGCVFGSHTITKKWGEIREFCVDDDPSLGLLTYDGFDRAHARMIYDRLLRIYEGAQTRQPVPNRDLKKQWNAGLFTGPILWSFHHFGDAAIDRHVEAWIGFLVNQRRDASLLDRTINNPRFKSGARSWNERRWKLAYYSIFDVAEAERLVTVAGRDDSSADSDSSDTD